MAGKEEIINKALEKDRDLRYQHAGDMRADLKRLKRESESGRQLRAEAAPKRNAGKLILGIAAAVVVIAVGLAAWMHYRSTQGSAIPPAQPATPATPVRTLAVLPFRDLSGQGTEVWGVGVADAIISRLVTLQNLTVRPTTSVLKYAKGTDDPGQAAQDLQVNSVLAGTYQQIAGVMRVSVQLIDHGAARWANRYDLKGHDMLRFEDEIAQKVVGELSVHLSGQEEQSLKTASTNSSEAYDLLLQARAYWTDYFVNSQRQALHRCQQQCRRAIDIDPNFVDAFALLAQAYSLEATNFQDNGARNLSLAEQSARKAMALNPRSFEANLSLGVVLGEEGKNAESIPMLREAAMLAPNSALVWKHLGYIYHYAGLTDLAEAAFHRGRDLDPVLPQAYWMHGRMLLYQGKTYEAEQEVRRALERFPDQFKLLMFLGYFLYYQGKTDEGLQFLDRSLQASASQADEEPMVLSAIVHASRGERDKINPKIFAYKPEEIVDGDLAEWIGDVYSQLGDKPKALACLRQAVRRGNHNYPWFQRDKNWDKVRGDPEFQRIMGEVEGYWRHYTELFGQSPS